MKRSQRLPLQGRVTATELHSKPQPGFSGHKNDILGLTVSLGLQITPICRVKWGRQNTRGRLRGEALQAWIRLSGCLEAPGGWLWVWIHAPFQAKVPWLKSFCVFPSAGTRG